MRPRPDRGFRLPRADDGGDDDGFLLIETLVAIGIVLIVMVGLGTFLLTMVATGGKERARQTAFQLSTAGIDRARAIGAAGAVSGRDSSSSASQLAHSPATPDYPAKATAVAPWLTGMTTAVDTTAASNAGASAALPTVATHQTVDGYAFSTSYFVGYCWRSGTVTNSACTAAATAGSVQNVRVVVVTSWSGTSCPSTGCAVVTASLVNGLGDPVFNFDQSPPPQPQLTTVATQTSAVGDTVNGITATDCAAPCPVTATSGVLPFIFTSSGLPPGLSMNSSGVVTGTPTTAGTYSVSVTVTDAFLDTSSTSFTWVVYSTLKFTTPANQTSKIGDTISLQVTGATGGSGSPYTWTATGLPTGLSIASSTGKITGKITAGAAQPFAVTITLTDSSGTRSATGSFTWTVPLAPLTGGKGTNQADTVGQPVNVSLSGYSGGGSGQMAWSDPGTTLPSGLSIAADNMTVTGTPNTPGTSAVTLTGTDLQTGNQVQSTFTWTISAAPTVAFTVPGSVRVNKALSPASAYTYSASCPAAPCTLTATGLPTGISASLGTTATTTLKFSGTPTTKKTYTVTLKVTDVNGFTVTISTFTWTVTN